MSHVDEALKIARKKYRPGDIISIAKYSDEQSFLELQNIRGIDYKTHLKIVNEIEIKLKSEGYRVRVIPMNIFEYRQWLGDDLNTQILRAKYISLKMMNNPLFL